MKFQTRGRAKRYGLHNTVEIIIKDSAYKENTWAAAEPLLDYTTKRANGGETDAPNTAMPKDGTYTWETGEADGNCIYGEPRLIKKHIFKKDVYEYDYKVRYDEGPGDRAWMEERDRNYVFRLEREGRLDQVEPNLCTAVPKLYEEVMKYRAERQATLRAQEEARKKAETERKKKEEEAARIEAERKRKAEADRTEAERKRKAEADRTEAERKRKAEADRIAVTEKKAEADRIAVAEKKAEADRIAVAEKKAEEERLEKERLEEEKIQKELEEAEKEVEKLKKLEKLDSLKKEKEKLKQSLSQSSEEKINSQSSQHSQNSNVAQNTEEKELDQSYLIPYEKLELGSELGQGGFGTVYRGEWQHIPVAVKKLHLNQLSDHALQEFKAEASVMTKLHHLNILTLYGVSIDKPGHYSMVIEYMPCGSLFTLLQSNKPLSWDLRYQISMDICAGLFHLHEKNILHRDLKSMNVLLDDRMRAKLSDFGLSKLKTETTTTATQAGGSAAGTIPWMAPELFKRKGRDTKASDIYSLGMVFWEIVSRAIPFSEAKDPMMIIAWKKEGEKEDIPEDCPPKYGELIGQCWKDKDQRPTIQALAQSLKAIFQSNTASPSILQSGPIYQFETKKNVNESGPVYQM